MKKKSFHDGWICCRTREKNNIFEVTLPHDAMLLDQRSGSSPGGVNSGWYDAQDYIYEKRFFVPQSYEDKKIIFEFEGVYHKASVYLNNEKAAYHSFGYTGFYIDASELLDFGAENTMRVEVRNSDQPNSRWYSGTGIYRPVWMYIMPQRHIKLDGIKITTLDYENPLIRVEAETIGEGNIKVEILDEQRVIHIKEGNSKGKYAGEISLYEAHLWNVDTPNLYTCRVTFGEDVQEVKFGIRVVECTPEKGFCINGRRVILRGACLHHDNGILGACAYDFAEQRKIRIIKESGYNAIRSAHNPCSKALLNACDKQGMLVVDEYTDMWYTHKTQYDYASEVQDNYEEDLAAIVQKDYNHPSVVMYSTGNEVSETAQKKGIKLCEELTKQFHELDETRPVTCGINIFFNFLSSVGFGIYSDKKAAQEVMSSKKQKAVGSEFFNNLAGLLGAEFMKFGATLYPCDVKTRDAFSKMDVAGYNYGIKRYKKDLKKYPDRMILGSETFCSDAYQFWEMAKKNKRILGDFVWTGMDYLGEVGLGAWEYKEYAPDFSHGAGWLTAGSGRIDLTGKSSAEMKYTRVAFELDEIGIGVVPVNHSGEKHSPSAWRMSNALESWSWNGLSGRTTMIEVYARAHHVSLYVNGKCVGTEEIKNDCIARFNTTYQDGVVKAIAYDEKNIEIAHTTLKTAGEETILTVEPEQSKVNAEKELCYIRLKFTDKAGIVKPLVRGEIKVHVKGGELLGLGSACPYYLRGYLTDSADTYYGEALAIIRPEGEQNVTVMAESRHGSGRAEIEVY